jgi:hypothetical protein
MESGVKTLSATVRAYMDKAGDYRILLDCVGYMMHLPLVKSAWAPCTVFQKGKQTLIVIGTKGLYLFPNERIPLDQLTEIVVHTHCSSAEPVCELTIATSADSIKETRYFAVPSETMLQEVVNTLRTVALKARLLFHELHWPATSWETHQVMSDEFGHGSPDRSGVRGAHSSQAPLQSFRSSLGDGSHRWGSGTTARRIPSLYSPKLETYHRRKLITGEGIKRVSAEHYREGRFLEAADLLAENVTSMLSQIQSILPAGQSSPTAPPANAPARPGLTDLRGNVAGPGTEKLGRGTNDPIPRAVLPPTNILL